MSIQIPITISLLHKTNVAKLYGTRIGGFIVGSNPPANLQVKGYDQPGERLPGCQYRVEAYSRGGITMYQLEQLFRVSGFEDLLFLVGQGATHTVDVESDDRDREQLLFTLIKGGYEHLISRTESFLQWCRENPDVAYNTFENLGSALDGRYFDDVVDLIDNTDYSLHPNDDYCERDSGDATLAISTLKTFIRFLKFAKGDGESSWNINPRWVVVEHREALEPADVGV